MLGAHKWEREDSKGRHKENRGRGDILVLNEYKKFTKTKCCTCVPRAS
jgi:hypothetical protein